MDANVGFSRLIYVSGPIEALRMLFLPSMIKSQMIRTRTLIVLVTLWSTFFASIAVGQVATLRGHIYDEATGEAVSFCNLTLAGTTMRTVSDLDGFFIFTRCAGRIIRASIRLYRV